MATTITVIVIILVVVAVAAVLLMMKRKRESARLQERFGPEYDRAVGEHGGRRAAEHRLSDVAARRDKAEVRDLTPEERSRFGERWTAAQADFVDSPSDAASTADDLVGEVMRTRGFPLDEVDDRGDLVAADHADLARHYRAAHAIGSRSSEASTEELRQAFVHYRHLFTTLLGEEEGRQSMRVEDGQPPEQLDLTRPEHTGATPSRDGVDSRDGRDTHRS